MLDLQKILGFSRLLNEFRKVTRVVHVNGEDRWENDVEHSYQLALLAWYIADHHKLDLDRDRIIQYALIHDFVEVYAGDTYVYTTDKAHRNNKEERERAAAKRLREEFPEFEDLHRLIERYERREDGEARFVYALDKIQPVINIYMNNGRTWKEKGLTAQMIIEYKRDQVALSPELASCFAELSALLKKEEEQLFGSSVAE